MRQLIPATLGFCKSASIIWTEMPVCLQIDSRWRCELLHAVVCPRYKALSLFTKEDARAQFLRILRTLPYGNATFFTVKRIEDPIGLLPAKLILGINKRGVHFFRPVPKEYLHSAELRDIMQVCWHDHLQWWAQTT